MPPRHRVQGARHHRQQASRRRSPGSAAGRTRRPPAAGTWARRPAAVRPVERRATSRAGAASSVLGSSGSRAGAVGGGHAPAVSAARRPAPASRTLVSASVSQSPAIWRSTLGERRHPVARLVGEVRAAVERLAVRREEHAHRPAAAAGQRLHGVHVDRVDVGPLLPVDLDADECAVHRARRSRRLRSSRAP